MIVADSWLLRGNNKILDKRVVVLERNPDMGLFVKEGQGTRAQIMLLWSSPWTAKMVIGSQSLDVWEEAGGKLPQLLGAKVM